MSYDATVSSGHIDIDEVKLAASGRWRELLAAVGGFDDQVLDGRHHPCPRCGGTDRFRMINEQAGAVLCNQCFANGNGDGLAAIQWRNDWTFGETLKAMAGYLGIAGGDRKPVDILAEVARLKRMPLESFKAFGAHRNQRGRLEVARVPMFDAKLQPCSNFDLALVSPDFKKGMSEKGKPVGLFVTIADPPKPSDMVLVTEGVKDSAALHSLGFKAVGLPTCKMDVKFARVFGGCHVVIVPDRDTTGEDSAKITAARLKGVAASVRIATLPADLKAKDGDGVREVLAMKDGETLLRQAIEDAKTWEPATDGEPSKVRLDDSLVAPTAQNDRVEIVLTTDEAVVNELTIGALTNDESLFQRAGKLVHIVKGLKLDGIEQPDDAPRIVVVSLAGLRERLTRVVRFVTLNETKEGEHETRAEHPPKWCYEAIAARGQWSGIRSLAGVVTAPVLRPDGSVLNSPGYDPATGLLFDPQGVSFPIIKCPSRDDAVRAAASLMDLVKDFPFAKADHGAAWLAFLLTPLARFAFTGPSPLFLVDANTRGSGKSLLCDIVALIITGREMSRMANPKDDDEARKRITALALAGDTMCLIDNIVGGLGCASLDAALTGTSWKDRILGRTEIVELPLLVTWSATGNNVVLHADTSRRVAHIRLDSPLENPEQREGFQHPNLKAFVREHRPKLLADVLTILAAFCRAGHPQQKLPTWGSFEGWSDLVRQAVVWCGQADPGATRTELVEQSDREAIALRELLTGWDDLDPDCFGLTTAEILTRLSQHSERYDQVRNAVLELCPPQAGHSLPSPGSFGKKLGHLRGRVVSGRSIDRRPNRKKTSAWFVTGETAGDDGLAGDTTALLSRDVEDTHKEAYYGKGAEMTPASPSSPAIDSEVEYVEEI